MTFMTLLSLLSLFIVCTALSLLFCFIAKMLFPKFRSGEHKPGTHRSDIPASMPAGGREIKTIELPLVGGPAFTFALMLTGIGAGYLLHFTRSQWTLLLIGIGTMATYMLIGFIDDWHKVYSKEGISEKRKFSAVFLVGAIAAVFYFFLVPASGQISYSPYKDIALLGSFLCPIPTEALNCSVITSGPLTHYGWLIFLMLLTGFTGSATSLSVDFSDGLDGLAGGLVFTAALAFGIIVTGSLNSDPAGIVVEVLALLCAASVLGYLPWNWPSSWAARARSSAKRRARIYMGDSGALALGGLLAIVAIFSRQELSLFLIGGAFVLEGLSALVNARLMTPLFRKRLKLLRFANTNTFVPHTEFPLPFLATPLHCHFDLLGWDRRRLVYGGWALGACFALLGVMAGLAPLAWERYLGRILALILAWGIWSSGSWSKRYFVGKHPAERTRRRRLALYYGYPYRIIGINLCHLVEIIEANEDVIETPAEEVALWQRMNIYDARALLGLYCYRAGYYPAALAQWTRIPERNRALRPEIARLLTEVDNRIALEKQETQPMRRSDIMHQEPILSGNLQPADLPNPYEPVRSEEKIDNHAGEWKPLQPPQYKSEKPTIDRNYEDGGQHDEDDEEHIVTAPLRNEQTRTHTSMPSHTGKTGTSGYTATSQTIDALRGSTTLQNWLSRLLRFSSSE